MTAFRSFPWNMYESFMFCFLSLYSISLFSLNYYVHMKAFFCFLSLYSIFSKEHSLHFAFVLYANLIFLSLLYRYLGSIFSFPNFVPKRKKGTSFPCINGGGISTICGRGGGGWWGMGRSHLNGRSPTPRPLTSLPRRGGSSGGTVSRLCCSQVRVAGCTIER